MTKFTVWVQQDNGEGTCHISSHEAKDAGVACEMALAETAGDWGCAPDDDSLRVLGVAKGDVEIIEWNDE